MIHVSSMAWFISDDAYISFRYARNLAETGQLVYNPGQFVEGYSNFLWVLILAFFHLLRIPMAWTAHAFNIASALWILWSMQRLCQFCFPGDPLRRNALNWAMLAGLCGFAPFAFWVSGGLETLFFTALLLDGTVRCLLARESITNKETPNILLPVLVLAAAALTRPEGILLGAVALVVPGLAALGQAWRRRNEGWMHAIRSLGPIVGMVLIWVALVGAHFLWRRWYYGRWLPMTHETKIAGIDPAFLARHGRTYAHAFFSTFKLYWYLPLIPGLVFTDRRRRWAGFVSLAFFLLMTGHIIRAGGDFMALFRFFVPVWPFFVIAVMLGLSGWMDLPGKPRMTARFGRAWQVLLLASILVPVPWIISSIRFARAGLHSETPQSGMESIAGMVHYVRDRELVGRALARLIPAHQRERTLMIVGGAGAISHESRMGTVHDTFGLVDPEIASRTVVPGKFYKPGHLKQASFSHVRQKNADILCNPHVAWIGHGILPERNRKQVERNFPGYVTFCLALPLSSPDRGPRRTHYCCLRKQDRLEQLILDTVVP